MGYQATLKFPEGFEFNSKFKPNLMSNQTLFSTTADSLKQEILLYCMQNHDEDTDTMVLNHLKLQVGVLIDYIKDSRKTDYLDMYNNEQEIWFCGYGYSGDYSDFEYEDLRNNTVETLSILAKVVKTPDYFNEQELFYEKINSIKNALDIDSMVVDIIDHEFLSMYRKTYDYYDGEYWNVNKTSKSECDDEEYIDRDDAVAARYDY